jgi:hypothetical protein
MAQSFVHPPAVEGKDHENWILASASSYDAISKDIEEHW